MKLYNGYERLSRNYTLMTDEYQHSMAYGYYLSNKKDTEAVFDVFFRTVPNNGSYAVMAGLDKIIPYIENLKFDGEILDYFKRIGYNEDFIKYLKEFKFTGSIYAIPDGTPVFPNEPLITIKAPLIEAQLIETCVLCMINGAMEHATGARRIIEATPKNIGVLEFGSRRADGPEAAIDSSIYGIMAGCMGTSNIMAADMLNLRAKGTMAHSFIETFDTELEAFMAYAQAYPNNCILLVDTYNTLESGVINAIKTFEYMRKNNMNLDNIGIRIDSGDLSYLSIEARKMFDKAGFPQVKICLSNGLTAETIESLINQGASFDVLGVGDNISKPEGRMGCVYKEVAIKENGVFEPRIKLSNSEEKIINPGYKELYRLYDRETGYAIADVMTNKDEEITSDNLLIIDPKNIMNRKEVNNFELKKLQVPIFIDGELVYEDPEIMEKKTYCENQMQTLYKEIRRTLNPQNYYVDGTIEYVDFRNDLINKTKQKTLVKDI